ncbi:hypothetical protein DFH11DRAFT_1539997 [Phellopilus nigrolimitatus]|nr:hypothetical protein DFH11DRAFT_1539997 [Phellopilus nigrolimitatus]
MSMKKRNLKNRPPTITTLTPSSPSPLPAVVSTSAQQARPSVMSQPFNSSGPVPASNGHDGAPAAYHPALPNFSAFPGLNSFAQSLNNQSQLSIQTPTQQSFFPQITRPHASGTNDVEKLERLKKEILEGQNPIYKAVPQPNFLESLYLGRPLQVQGSVPAHPEQVTIGAKESTNPQTPPASAQNADSPDSTISSSRPDSTSLGRSSSMPQIGSKMQNVLQMDQRLPYSSQMTTQDTPKFSSSNGTAGLSKHSHTYASGQQNARPTSEKLLIQAASDTHSPRHPGPLSSSVSSKDPPYDPKEMLMVWMTEADELWTRVMQELSILVMAAAETKNENVKRKEIERRIATKRVTGAMIIVTTGRRSTVDDYHDRRISSASSTEPRDPRSQDLKRQDSRHSDDRMDVDVRRPIPVVSDRSFRPADDRISRPALPGDRLIRPSLNDSPTKTVSNGTDQIRFIPSSLPPGSVVKPQSTVTDDRHVRVPSNSHARLSVDERPRPLDDRARLSSGDDRVRQPSGDDRSHRLSQGSERSDVPPALEERIGARASVALEDRIGIRIPLEERITSPPLDRLARPAVGLQERIGDRPLEERIGSRPVTADSRGQAGGDPSRPSDGRPVSGQQASARPPRPIDEKVISPSPASAAVPAGRTIQQRADERSSRSSSSDVGPRSDDRLQSRPSNYASDTRSHVHQSPHMVHNATRQPEPSRLDSASDLLRRDKYRETSDPRLIPAAAYRNDHDRRYADTRRPDLDAVGHYERPPLRESDPALVVDRGRPSLETREWRERASYPPRTSSSTRPETYPPPAPPVPARDWSSSERIYAPTEVSWDRRSPPPVIDTDRDRYVERDFDRRTSVPPRSWDRDDTLTRARPLPEVYPPVNRIDTDRGRYPPADFREPSRVRARSPSPLRRSSSVLDDLRPAKRVREENAYYDDRQSLAYGAAPDPYTHSRVASPPPPSTASSYL